MVCEGWCVKDGLWRCVTDGVWQSCVRKMVSEKWWVSKMVCQRFVCDKVVCERWCVKDGVWKIVCDKVVCEMVCDKVVCEEGVSKMVCERWSVTKWYVTDGVWQSCVWKMVCQRWWVQAPCQSEPSALSTTPATQNEGGCLQVPRLPGKTKLDVAKRHACHAKRRWMSPSATPAAQSAAASLAPNPVQARHQSQPNALSTTPATQNEGGCHELPHLPRKTELDVAKCHACHAKWKMVVGKGVCERWCVCV